MLAACRKLEWTHSAWRGGFRQKIILHRKLIHLWWISAESIHDQRGIVSGMMFSVILIVIAMVKKKRTPFYDAITGERSWTMSIPHILLRPADVGIYGSEKQKQGKCTVLLLISSIALYSLNCLQWTSHRTIRRVSTGQMFLSLSYKQRLFCRPRAEKEICSKSAHNPVSKGKCTFWSKSELPFQRRQLILG